MVSLNKYNSALRSGRKVASAKRSSDMTFSTSSLQPGSRRAARSMRWRSSAIESLKHSSIPNSSSSLQTTRGGVERGKIPRTCTRTPQTPQILKMCKNWVKNRFLGAN
eukprot:5103570-Amphidinium_carterae.1